MKKILIIMSILLITSCDTLFIHPSADIPEDTYLTPSVEISPTPWHGLPEDSAFIDLVATISFVSNIIVGTPIEIVFTDGQMSSSMSKVSNISDPVILTDYIFTVKDYIFGIEGEQKITVRSLIGNVFEIGKEYTFAANRIFNVYWDQYSVVGHNWIVDNENVTESDFDSFISAVRSVEGTDNIRPGAPNVNKKASASEEYIDSVDVVLIVTIVDFFVINHMNDLIITHVEVHETLKGTVQPEILREGLILKGDIEIGESYLLLLSNENGVLTLSSREGSIINIKDSIYDDYIKILREN